MSGSSEWKPPAAVVFGTILCLLMLGGEGVTNGCQNPMALVFYCFLPVVLWMMANEQKRNVQAISELNARLDQLEKSRQP
ncbi:MAG: hypothetical protein ACKO23_16525 [Gemmataceae bacterium]